VGVVTVKRFACGDVIPGCALVVTGAGDQSVLDQVLAHAAAEHGMVNPPLSLLELVMAHTHPLCPDRGRGHLRLVDPHPGQHDPVGETAPADGRGGPTGGPAHADPVPAAVRRIRAHESYRHECVLYGGLDDFLTTMVPFIRDGLAREEPVMVAVAQPRLRALRSALGPDADTVRFADMADLGANPARIIPAWRDFTQRYSGPGRPVRGIGEPIWAGRRPVDIVESQLHEALLNTAVAPDTPLWLLCPYDTTTLGKEVLAEAHRSHPVIVRGNDYRGSTSYGGTVHIDTLFHRPLPDPAGPVTGIVFDRDRHRHIEQLIRHARTAGLPPADAVKLAVAVHEIAAAAYHDTGDVRIRLWTDRAALLCEITDPGRITDPMIGRTGSSTGTARDRAAGLANQLCELVQIRSAPDGTITRLHTRQGATSC
jgi:predicted small metal-binding protein